MLLLDIYVIYWVDMMQYIKKISSYWKLDVLSLTTEEKNQKRKKHPLSFLDIYHYFIKLHPIKGQND